MKLKKLSMLLSLPLVLGMASCGGPGEGEESGSQAKGSTTSSKSVAPRTSVPPRPTVSISSLGIENGTDNKAYVVVTGTHKNFTDTSTIKFAFGLQHKSVQNVDTSTDWAVGTASPADADYKYIPTFGENGALTVKFELDGLQGITKGAYSIYAGIKGAYNDLTAALGGDPNQGEENHYTGGKVGDTAHRLKYYLRPDVSALIADDLPPVSLTEVRVEKGEDDHPYVYIGGELIQGVTSEEFLTFKPYVNFQNNGSSGAIGGGAGQAWSNTRMDVANNEETGLVTVVVDGTKGYVKIDVSSLGSGGYNTHLNFTAKTQADAKMDVAINTVDTPVTIGAHTYAFYCDPTASSADGSKYWGNLALIIADAPAADSSVQ
ncbi:MAG: hypothetical protein K6G74_00760 [Bacilli bacterium]|nr:hypothetical protein [Bacilli bacterium]